MVLTEALMVRSDMAKRLEQLEGRLIRNAKVQEGDTPAEDPVQMLAEFDRHVADLQSLIARINATNASTVLEGGVTMTQALAERDMLRLRVSAYRDLAKEATITQSRTPRSEVRFHPTVLVAQMQKRVGDYSKQLRLLDVRIQKHDWNTELGGLTVGDGQPWRLRVSGCRRESVAGGGWSRRRFGMHE